MCSLLRRGHGYLGAHGQLGQHGHGQQHGGESELLRGDTSCDNSGDTSGDNSGDTSGDNSGDVDTWSLLLTMTVFADRL